MKIIVIGGTGLIGTKVIKNLRDKGQEVVAASPSKGINSVTGEGLAAARRLLSMSQMHPPGRTRQFWSFSKRRVPTSWLRKPPRTSAIMWRCRLSAPTACSRAVTSARRWLRKI